MKLTFRGHRIYSSIRLDETNTMGPILLLYLYIKMKKLFFAVKYLTKKSFFDFSDLWRLNC